MQLECRDTRGERLYKGQVRTEVKMLRARLVLSQAQTGAAKAKARVQETLLMREELAHACTRCKLPYVGRFGNVLYRLARASTWVSCGPLDT